MTAGDAKARKRRAKASPSLRGRNAPSGDFTGQTLKISLPQWITIPNAGLASSIAVIGTNPVDRAKTIAQLPGGKYGKSAVDALRIVCKQEGLWPGLYRGLPVAMIRESSKNMFRIGLFLPILGALHRDPDAPAPAWKRFVAGTLTGAIGAVSSNPFDLVKTRMHVPAALSEYTGFTQAMRSIARKEGVGTFYKGVGASVLRDMLGSSVNLTVQSLASEWLVSSHVLTPGSPVLGAISGVLSAAASVAVMQPIDTSRAYVYLKPHLHRDTIKAFRFIVLREGPWALYRGSRAHFFRTAPHYALMFALLETIAGMERRVLHRRNKEQLARVPIFGTLSDEERDKLAHGVRTQTFKRGERIVLEGDADDREMYYVLRGTARARVGLDEEEDLDWADDDRRRERRRDRPGSTMKLDESSPCAVGARGSSALLADDWFVHDTVIGAGDSFGEEALLVDEPRRASVVCTSEKTRCLIVDRVAYEVATRGTPENVFHARTRATTELEMMWRRLRFDRELERVPLLAELDGFERALLAKRCARVTFEPGVKITRQGDAADKFYILLSGLAVAVRKETDVETGALWKNLKGGAAPVHPQRVLRSYGPGAHFGELALLTGQPRASTVVAQERTEALVLDKNALMEMRATVPTLEDHIVRGMRHYDHIEQFTSMSMA